MDHESPIGECVITRHWNDGSVSVDRADPRVLIDAALLDEIRKAEDPAFRLVGDVLTIDAANRKVIYRIGEKAPDRLAYFAEWPD